MLNALQVDKVSVGIGEDFGEDSEGSSSAGESIDVFCCDVSGAALEVSGVTDSSDCVVK